ncbi:MAG TPA: tRNA pseudouridine(38-40) synthase TruA [Bacilli bacterium]|nr:tRNA pseudouridine(38-40) synthase TruA [Bacilli bacterium]
MRYLVTVSYNGAAYAGWQKQNDRVSVQGEIERVISTLFNKEISIFASGRTDAKVHALGQTFHFDGDKVDKAKLLYSLNKMLPNDIKLCKIKTVKDTFHARFNAIAKTYRYEIALSDKEPFLNDLRLIYPFAFDEDKFRTALALFEGHHDFKSFTSKPSDEAGYVREIFAIRVKKSGRFITTDFIGNGFMRGQIRMMIGTALAYANGKIELDYIKLRLGEDKRNTTIYKVGGEGLYLINVKY